MGVTQEIVQEPVNEDVLPDGWTLREHQDAAAVTTQGVLHGNPFQREVLNDISQERRVGVVAGRSGNQDIFVPAKDAPIVPSDFPEASLAQADTLFDWAEEGSPSLKTAQKAGASTPFVDTEAVSRARGGDPDHHIKKQDFSFAYKPGS